MCGGDATGRPVPGWSLPGRPRVFTGEMVDGYYDGSSDTVRVPTARRSPAGLTEVGAGDAVCSPAGDAALFTP